MMGPEQSSIAASKARRIRSMLIDLSYQLPNPATKAVLAAWTKADAGLYELIAALEEGSRS